MGSKRHMRNIQKHAKLRGQQRLGVSYTPSQLEQIGGYIRNKKAQLVDRLSWRVTRWKVNFEGHQLYVVYDENRRTILTLLDTSWLPTDGSTATLGEIAAIHNTTKRQGSAKRNISEPSGMTRPDSTLQYSTERQNKTKHNTAAKRNKAQPSDVAKSWRI